jgi:hypothetical protein
MVMSVFTWQIECLAKWKCSYKLITTLWIKEISKYKWTGTIIWIVFSMQQKDNKLILPICVANVWMICYTFPKGNSCESLLKIFLSFVFTMIWFAELLNITGFYLEYAYQNISIEINMQYGQTIYISYSLFSKFQIQD